MRKQLEDRVSHAKMSGQTLILLAEDGILNRTIYKYKLSELGFAIVEVESGNQAIEVLKEFRPDLVISDINMIDGSGFDVVEFIQKHDCTVPLIFITAATLPDRSAVICNKAYEMGAWDIFSKQELNWELINIRIQALVRQSRNFLKLISR